MQNIIPKLFNNKGVTAVVVALLMIVFLGIAALAVDIGYLKVSRSELQRAADAAALAGARMLGEIYKNQDPNLTTLVNNRLTLKSEGNAVTIIKTAAYDTALANKAAGQSVAINYQDADDKDYIKLGNWDPTQPKGSRFTENNTSPTVVQVKARNDNISTFFARIFSRDTMGTEVIATAALTPLCSGNPSPIGISKDWVDVTSCGSKIEWNDTQSSCAGWTTMNFKHPYKDLPKEIKTQQDLLTGLMGGYGTLPPINPPTLTSGNTTYFTGGGLGTGIFDAVQKIVDAHGGVWSTNVIVYDNPQDTSTECKNPSGDLTIVQFATVTIYGANVTAKTIDAKVDCNFTDDGRGCGTDYSGLVTYGDIPSLIE
ncbi:MAG: pilus assembly protein TadG-related protein [Smithella sp.]|nr:pilus assembly protein TadG-related protein [Smithella sp.]